MVTTPHKLTASETVLLAAADLTAAGNPEFTEWDLTVASWARDRTRFGLRGYAQTYPDHKRVMMEIMGQKASSPVQQKYLEKIRPNYYRLTPLGKAVAAGLRSGTSAPVPKPVAKAVVSGPAPGVAAVTEGGSVSVKDLYDTVSTYVNRAEFRRWQDNPEEPRDWIGAAAFLGLAGKDVRMDPIERLDEIRTAIQNAMEWCTTQDAAYLTRGTGQGGPPIHVSDLSNMLDFLLALTYRFPEALEKKGGPKGAPKHKNRLSD